MAHFAQKLKTVHLKCGHCVFIPSYASSVKALAEVTCMVCTNATKK